MPRTGIPYRRPASTFDVATQPPIYAARLASAAGLELGELRNLSSYRGAQYDEFGLHNSPYAYSMNRVLQEMRGRQGEKSDEAISATPVPVKYRVSVSARFALK